MREQISTTMSMPALQRLSPAEKARQRREEELTPATETEMAEPSSHSTALANKPRALPRTMLPSDAFFVKVGTRLPPDLVDWLKQQVGEYRRRNPHAPRLTIEELLRIAIVDLRARGPVDKTITRYRSTVSAS